MELNHKVFGSGDPIIILHGLFGMLDNWQTIAKQLAEEYMVYIIDQRNHGKSPRMDEMSYTLMAEDLAEFMESQGMHSAHIVGHSMGGKTAMQMAMDHEDMVETLTVIDISPTVSTRGHDAVFAALHSVDVANLDKRSEAEESMSQHINDRGVMQFLLKNLTRQKEGGYAWKMNLPVLTEQYERILDPVKANGSYDGPTLFVKGGRSRHIQDADLDTMRELFPNYKMEEIADAGHWVHAEDPKRTLAVIKLMVNGAL